MSGGIVRIPYTRIHMLKQCWITMVRVQRWFNICQTLIADWKLLNFLHVRCLWATYFTFSVAIVEYAEINATVYENASCSVKSSQPCNYTWKFKSYEESVVFGQDINLTRYGSYVCDASCPMRNKNCTITIKKVLVSSQGKWHTFSNYFLGVAYLDCVGWQSTNRYSYM